MVFPENYQEKLDKAVPGVLDNASTLWNLSGEMLVDPGRSISLFRGDLVVLISSAKNPPKDHPGLSDDLFDDQHTVEI